MNIEIMRRNYEKTPKETLINILISSREEVDKLQKRNKERKQEIERLNNIINKAILELERYENDNEANRYAPIRETLDILRGDEE